MAGGGDGTWETGLREGLPRARIARVLTGSALSHRPLSLHGKREKRKEMSARKTPKSLPVQWLASGGHSSLGNSRATWLVGRPAIGHFI
jgi:hypothetical protein